MIRVGQVYASTHKHDVRYCHRQERTVVKVDESFVWLRNDPPYGGLQRTSRIRLRQTLTGPTIPGHKLVRDKAP